MLQSWPHYNLFKLHLSLWPPAVGSILSWGPLTSPSLSMHHTVPSPTTGGRSQDVFARGPLCSVLLLVLFPEQTVQQVTWLCRLLPGPGGDSEGTSCGEVRGDSQLLWYSSRPPPSPGSPPIHGMVPACLQPAEFSPAFTSLHS